MSNVQPEPKASPFEDLFGIEPGSTPISGKRVHVAPDSITAVTETQRERVLVDPTTGDVVERKSEDVTEQELAKEERLEDLHIDGQLDNIREAAIGAFEHQQRMAQEADPRFSARNAEVAAQYLTIALNAVNQRVDAKYKRNKIKIARGEGKTAPATGAPQGVIVVTADRNEVLRAMMGKEANKVEKIINEDPSA